MNVRKDPASFFVISDALGNFNTTLKKLKHSNVWNTNGLFVAIADSFSTGCSYMYQTLKVMLSYDLYSVIFLCRGLEKKIILYTFNPFSNKTPKFWKELEQNYIGVRPAWKILYRVLSDESKLQKEYKS